MKILAIGDFHGKFPEKLKKEARKADLILSDGDYANADEIRKIIFKNWTGKKWYESIGLKKAGQMEKESFNSGLAILKKLNTINKKTYLIWGNTDFYKEYATSEPPVIIPGFYDSKLRTLRNLVLIDRKKKKIDGIEILGHGGYVDVTEFIRHPIDKEKEKQKKRLNRYKESEKELADLFKAKKPSNFIFLIHYTPYKVFDRVKLRASPMFGKNVGFEPYNRIIKKYKPFLVVCGHLHENQGKCKIGSSLVVNPGAASEGKAAWIEIDEKNKKVLSVRFLR
jgi:Icc-related predicted phosphoesterase